MSAHPLHGFAPDADRARALDAKMRGRLADSLEHVFEQARDALSFDARDAARLLAELRSAHRFGPLVFALYYDLVDAIVADRLTEAEALLDAILREHPASGGLEVASLDDADLGAGNAARYARMMDTDPESPFIFTAPEAGVADAFRQHLQETLALLRKAAPELHAEFSALVSQIVLAEGRSGIADSTFHGGSSFLLWGALFVNPARWTTPLALIETLAHESAHSLLFGLSIDETLVLNPDSERFDSPFRYDPRPMDGIYHATFVAARMHYAMERCLEATAGTAEEPAIREALARDERAFRGGIATVDAHARLSATGAAVMAAAREHMGAA